jgi:hypothetical protein
MGEKSGGNPSSANSDKVAQKVENQESGKMI